MIALARVAALAAVVAGLAAPAAAFVTFGPGARIEEVPVERLVANLHRNAQNLPPAQMWRAIGRVHLIAYVRQTATLPVFRDHPGTLAEGRIDDCAKVDRDGTSEEERKDWPKPKPGERCQARDYSVRPSNEIPSGAFEQSRTQSAHLTAALDAYGRATSLESSNLRTRLALAFVLDRMTRLPEARDELRFVLDQGGKRYPFKTRRELEQQGWETHVVLNEAVHHLSLIAESQADRGLVTVSKARLDANPPIRMVTPVLIPLKANIAFNDLIEPHSNVAFDFTGQGPAERVGWLSPDAAWLVWDPKREGKIESGFQLFGSVTWIMFWDNGYHALGSLDDNGDGLITGAELEGLALWHDKNANGVSEPGEVVPVTDHDIVALSYAHRRASTTLWVSKAGVAFRDGQTRPTYDWLLRSPAVLARN